MLVVGIETLFAHLCALWLFLRRCEKDVSLPQIGHQWNAKEAASSQPRSVNQWVLHRYLQKQEWLKLSCIVMKALPSLGEITENCVLRNLTWLACSAPTECSSIRCLLLLENGAWLLWILEFLEVTEPCKLLLSTSRSPI